MKLITVLIIAVFISTASAAQTKDKKHSQLLDVTGSLGSGLGSVSGSYIYNWHLGKKQKFSIGAGARFTSFFGSNQYYISAPAKITSGSTGPGVLFQENITANIDSLLVASPSMNALNLSINLGYQITPKIAAGFNIDAVGFSFGGEQTAKYVNGTTLTNTTAKPTGFNALLISDNDLGTLNSEIFATYKFRKQWAVKLGYQFLFTEYTTATNVQVLPEPNDRFRLKSGALAIGIQYQFK